jgi:hypothetical protein
MGVSYVYDDDMLVIVGESDYTTQEVKEIFLAAISNPRTTPETLALIDIRGCEATRTRDEVIALVDFLGSKREHLPARCAVVVASDLRFGFSRLASAHFEEYGIEVRVFRDIDLARQWLKAGALDF